MGLFDDLVSIMADVYGPEDEEKEKEKDKGEE